LIYKLEKWPSKSKQIGKNVNLKHELEGDNADDDDSDDDE